MIRLPLRLVSARPAFCWGLWVALLILLAGCGGYEIKNLAKTDVDLVTDKFVDESRYLVRELTVKLYRRNPDQLRKTRE